MSSFGAHERVAARWRLPGGAPLVFALLLDLSGGSFCEIIFSFLKNFRGPGAELHEIVPTQFQPRIDLLQFSQNNLRHTLARRVEGSADLRFMPAPHPRNF